MQLFARITKVDEATRRVWGRATQEITDRAGEKFDYASSKPHFEKWSGEIAKATDGKSVGNVRAMHGKVAAGKLDEITFVDDERAIDVCANIVDDQEWRKVTSGTYSGFSIGGSYVKKWDDPDEPGVKRYTASPAEISIVDLPCVPVANFTMIKADGMSVDVPFAIQKSESAAEGQPPVSTDIPAATDPAAGSDPDAATDDAEKAAVSAIANLLDHAKIKPTELQKLAEDAIAKRASEARTAAIAAAKARIEDDAITNGEVEKLAAELLTDEERAAVEGEGSVRNLGLLVKLRELVAVPEAPADTQPIKAFRKGLWDLSRLADAVVCIDFLVTDTEFEAAYEGDNSPIPARLRAVRDELAMILVEMADEETRELTEKAAREEMLAKVGARNSKADKARLQNIHDHSDMGAECATEKAASGALAKALGMEESAPEDVAKYIDTLRKKAKLWDDMPAAPKGPLRRIEKAQDIGGETRSEEEIAREDELKRAAESGDPLALTKYIHRHCALPGAPR